MRMIVIFALISFFVTSCTINKDLLFKSAPGFEYSAISQTTVSDYKIASNDELSIQLYPNGGERLLSISTGISSDDNNRYLNQTRNTITYRVKSSGTVELPEIGEIVLAGLTLEEAELSIEKAYSDNYHNPYVLLNVTNNRVLVFPGEAGQASVITLENKNTTVLEALALAGGVRSRGISSKVKLIRSTPEGREVYLLDLSTIRGLDEASLIVQANDIIYVSSNPEIASGYLTQITPIVSVFSSLSLLYAVIVGLR